MRVSDMAGAHKEPTLEVLYLFDAGLDARYSGSKWYVNLKARTHELLLAGAEHGIVHHKSPLSQV